MLSDPRLNVNTSVSMHSVTYTSQLMLQSGFFSLDGRLQQVPSATMDGVMGDWQCLGGSQCLTICELKEAENGILVYVLEFGSHMKGGSFDSVSL